jgi:hypothetical protein
MSYNSLDEIKGKKNEENTAECHKRLYEITDQLRSGVNHFKNSSAGNYANRAGKAIASKAKFVASSLSEAVKEPAEKHGIQTKRSFWREHPGYALLGVAGAVGEVLTGYSIASFFSDPWTQSFFPNKLPPGSNIVPSCIPHEQHNPPQIIDGRGWDIKDYLEAFVVPAIFAAMIIDGGVKYYKWRKFED